MLCLLIHCTLQKRFCESARYAHCHRGKVVWVRNSKELEGTRPGANPRKAGGPPPPDQDRTRTTHQAKNSDVDQQKFDLKMQLLRPLLASPRLFETCVGKKSSALGRFAAWRVSTPPTYRDAEQRNGPLVPCGPPGRQIPESFRIGVPFTEMMNRVRLVDVP